MRNLSYTNSYTFHGLSIAIFTNHPAVLTALQARLRQFTSNKNETPDLVFEFCCIPDRESHLVEKPVGQTRPVYEPPLGEVVYAPDLDSLYIDYADRVRVWCIPEKGYTCLSILASEVQNLWLLSHPLFTLPFIEILKRRGFYSIHAAGLCIDGRGILFAGPSGVGKSTLALALLRAGFGFLGDDMLFLRLNREGLRVLAFPDEIDCTDETADLFPELHSLLSLSKTPGWPKRQIWAEEIYKVDAVWECLPAVIVFPRVANTTRSILIPIDQDEALLELAPNVLLTECRSSQAHLDALAQLVRESVCYRLETGDDFDSLPELLRDVIA